MSPGIGCATSCASLAMGLGTLGTGAEPKRKRGRAACIYSRLVMIGLSQLDPVVLFRRCYHYLPFNHSYHIPSPSTGMVYQWVYMFAGFHHSPVRSFFAVAGTQSPGSTRISAWHVTGLICSPGSHGLSERIPWVTDLKTVARSETGGVNTPEMRLCTHYCLESFNVCVPINHPSTRNGIVRNRRGIIPGIGFDG